MEKAQSFHEIFMAHLSQNPSFSEEKAQNFDHTLYEKPHLRHRVLHFSNPLGAKNYASKPSESPSEELPKSSVSPSMKSTAASQTPETVTPPVEPKITMKDLNTPELLAAASIVTGYMGDTGFLPRTERELKKAYRKMLLTEHPDHGGNTEGFTGTLEAFRLVLDVAKNLKSD